MLSLTRGCASARQCAAVFTVTSLLFAITIAGAFWVGVLAARRLRDWGDGRRALEEQRGPVLALGAGGGVVPSDEETERVRARVAARLEAERLAVPSVIARDLTGEGQAELGLATLRPADVVVVEAADPAWDGDFVVEGLCVLRDGVLVTYVVVMADGGRKRWLVGEPQASSWLLLTEIVGHGLRGEPPRQIRRGEDRQYTLERRSQASVSGIGAHGRPAGARVATYTYRASLREVLWLERWGDEVLMGEGQPVPAHVVSFLPGS
jgi:hypothetical protein